MASWLIRIGTLPGTDFFCRTSAGDPRAGHGNSSDSECAWNSFFLQRCDDHLGPSNYCVGGDVPVPDPGDVRFLTLPGYGLINVLLRDIGLERLGRNWFGDETYAFLLVLIMHLWRNVPFYAVAFLAAMQAVRVAICGIA